MVIQFNWMTIVVFMNSVNGMPLPGMVFIAESDVSSYFSI
jgi:hypothetical protein